MSDVIANLMKTTFDAPRNPRSFEYQQGCEAILKFRMTGDKPQQPYALGTAQADAWFAGAQEGHYQATKWQQKQIQDRSQEEQHHV